MTAATDKQVEYILTLVNKLTGARARFTSQFPDGLGISPPRSGWVATFVRSDRSCLPLWTALEEVQRAECLRKLTAPERQDPRRAEKKWAIGRGWRLAAASRQGAVKADEHRPCRSDGCGHGREQARSGYTNKASWGRGEASALIVSCVS
jgi:hypothetical protein